MQLIFGKDVAEQLREKYTVLELERVPVNIHGETLDTYCVLEPEKIVFEMSTLENSVALHNQLVEAIKDNNTEVCLTLADILMGKFGGELDSFYEVIVERINTTGSTELQLKISA